MSELDLYQSKYNSEVALAEKIFHQESNFCHFFTDVHPLVSFDNGYGLGQATEPIPSFVQTWNWKEHVKYIVTQVIPKKRSAAKRYLDRHKLYTEDDLDMETLVYYNRANHHYIKWSAKDKRWERNTSVVCDPAQSNKGWDATNPVNVDKPIEELRKGEGGKPIYTGACYAEHIRNKQGI
ncbi:MAG: hypothetical protein ACXWVG_12020 [Telluria sp.]